MSDELRIGTVRRAPEGFAHAILLEQPAPARWEIVDAHGSGPKIRVLFTDEEVANWPVVYEPMDDGVWALMVSAE